MLKNNHFNNVNLLLYDYVNFYKIGGNVILANLNIKLEEKSVIIITYFKRLLIDFLSWNFIL